MKDIAYDVENAFQLPIVCKPVTKSEDVVNTAKQWFARLLRKPQARNVVVKNKSFIQWNDIHLESSLDHVLRF